MPEVRRPPEDSPADAQMADPDQAGARVSRRALVIGAAGATAGVGVAALGVRGAVNGLWDVGQGSPYELWRTWRAEPGLRMIAAAGVLAANPHNLQPWRFLIGPGRIDLYADPTRVMPVNDADLRERRAGYGCAIENMVCAARAVGMRPHLDLTPTAADHRIAGLTLIGGGPSPTDVDRRLAAAIPLRHSNRGPFRGEPVDTDALVAAAAPGIPGAGVAWISDPDRRASLGRLLVDATSAIINDDPMSVEAFSWFRSDRRDVSAHRDGLTLDCQGLGPFTLGVAKILPASSRRHGDAFWLKTTRDVHTATAAAFGIIRVRDAQDPQDQISGGRLLERLHLAAASQGMGFQHMNQITETIARDRALGRTPRFAARLQDVTGVSERHALLAFRIGWPERGANLSPRRALTDVL